MPRRNRKARRRGAPRPLADADLPELTYDEMALRLVKAGKASVAVLGALPPRRPDPRR